MPTPALTDAQCEDALRLVELHGSITAAATAENINRATLQGRVSEARRRKAGMIVTGRSTLTDLRTGEPVMEWVKESLDRQQAAEAQQAAYAVLAAELPRIASTAAPRASERHLCTVYSYFDYHVGMLAWNREGGDDWDLSIAEDRLFSSYAALVDQSPRSHKAVVVIGGDWLHTDGLLPLTPASKHILDADGRFSKIVQIAIKGIRHLTTLALERHAEVELVIMEGNHDETGSVWLRHMFTAASAGWKSPFRIFTAEAAPKTDSTPIVSHVLFETRRNGHLVRAGKMPSENMTERALAVSRTSSKRKTALATR